MASGQDETRESETFEELRWLMKPPRAGEVMIKIGETTDLTPEIKNAIEDLMEKLQETKKVLFAANAPLDCKDLDACSPVYWCRLRDCDLNKYPCVSYVHCKIG